MTKLEHSSGIAYEFHGAVDLVSPDVELEEPTSVHITYDILNEVVHGRGIPPYIPVAKLKFLSSLKGEHCSAYLYEKELRYLAAVFNATADLMDEDYKGINT